MATTAAGETAPAGKDPKARRARPGTAARPQALVEGMGARARSGMEAPQFWRRTPVLPSLSAPTRAAHLAARSPPLRRGPEAVRLAWAAFRGARRFGCGQATRGEKAGKSKLSSVVPPGAHFTHMLFPQGTCEKSGDTADCHVDEEGEGAVCLCCCNTCREEEVKRRTWAPAAWR